MLYYTDSSGNPVYPKAVVVDKVVDALGRATVFSCDEAQDKPSVTGKVNPDNSTVSLTYTSDPSGNLVRIITDEGGNKIRHLYDSQKRLIRVEMENPKESGNFAIVEERSYDPDNNPTSRKDGNGNLWTMRKFGSSTAKFRHGRSRALQFSPNKFGAQKSPSSTTG